jgi:hypothetical protein
MLGGFLLLKITFGFGFASTINDGFRFGGDIKYFNNFGQDIVLIL